MFLMIGDRDAAGKTNNINTSPPPLCFVRDSRALFFS